MRKYLGVFLVVAVCLALSIAGTVLAAPAQAPTAAISYDCSSQSAMAQQDCEALVDLYNGTSGDSWDASTGWGAGEDPCTWLGVTCTGNRVTTLNLSGNNMDGTLPDSFGNLTDLEFLDLSDNSLDNQLPDSFVNLSSLTQLNLNTNNFSGTFPEPLLSLTNLGSLDISINNFDGFVPVQVANMSGLQNLLISGNNFSGLLPSEWSYLTNMTHLDVSDNNFRGGVPAHYSALPLFMFDFSFTELYEPSNASYQTWKSTVTDYTASGYSTLFDCSTQATLTQEECDALVLVYQDMGGAGWTSKTNWLSGDASTWQGAQYLGGRLYAISLSSNNLTGTLPPELGQVAELYRISMDNNAITGGIPVEWSDPEWQMGDLSLNTNQLSGELPPAFFQSSYRYRMNLGANQLTGSIPPEISEATNLDFLDLSNNMLSGTIPAEIGELSNLYQLSLGGNSDASDPKLSGTLPTEMGNLTNLSTLSIMDTEITGTIPDSFADLDNLQYFRLSSNPLMTGTLPAALGDMDKLETLNLNLNGFTGSIPASLASAATLKELHFTDNDLTGAIPEALSTLPLLEKLDISNNNFSGAVPISFTDLDTLLEFRAAGSNLCEYLLDDGYVTWTGGLSFYSGTSTSCAPTLVSPPDGKTTTYQTLTFRWGEIPGATKYGFQIARDAAFTDIVYQLPMAATQLSYGPLDYDQTYYWHVTAGKGTATWTDYSDVWSVNISKDTWEPNDTQGAAVGNFNMATQYQQYVQGYVNDVDDQDWFSYYIESGQCVRFWINMQYRTKSYDSADMQLVIYRPDGSLLGMNNDGGAYNDPAIKVCFTETGTYTVRAKLEKGALPAADGDKTYQLMAQWLDVPTLTAPANHAVTSDRTPTFRWQAVELAQIYDIQVATDASFSHLVFQKSVRTLTYTPTTNLDANDTYYWRVRARNLRNIGDWSVTRDFRIP